MTKIHLSINLIVRASTPILWRTLEWTILTLLTKKPAWLLLLLLHLYCVYCVNITVKCMLFASPHDKLNDLLLWKTKYWLLATIALRFLSHSPCNSRYFNWLMFLLFLCGTLWKKPNVMCHLSLIDFIHMAIYANKTLL